MLLQDYLNIPKGEQQNMKIGDRFRPLESKDFVNVGNIVTVYEVIDVKKSGLVEGYEVVPCYEKIEMDTRINDRRI